MTSSRVLLLFLGLICFSAIECGRKRFHKHRFFRHEERELKRTKRDLDTELGKIFTRIQVSPIKHSKRSKRSSYRPYVAGQVQDVRIEIKLKAYWKDELANKYTPQFRLLAGNVVDEISNALIDNRNFLEANVLRFRPSKWNVLADVSMKFFKTEVDPLHYLEGIVASGWISGLQVFKNYFQVIKIVNGNVNFPAWNYPKGLRLRLHPAVLTKVNAVKKIKHKVVLPANYKEIKISFQLYQKWNTLFLATFSSPYRLLSGNIEQSLDEAFSGSPNYLNSQVLSFRESTQGQTVVDMFVRFSNAEVYPAQKLKILISSGNVGDTPVISDSLEIYEINNVTSDQPIQEPIQSDEFPKPHSDANVNQNTNETETDNNKVKQVTPERETALPIYPLAKTSNGQNTKAEQSQTNQTPPVTQTPSDEATMSMKVQRLKFVKQTGLVIMEHQQVKPWSSEAGQETKNPTATEGMKTPEAPKNNVVAETAMPIYPKQMKISDSVIPSVSQPQPQKQQQQQAPSQYQVAQQQTYPMRQQQQQNQWGSSQQISPANEKAAPLEGNLWHDLPEQVEGKLVMNQEKPVSPILSKEIEQGNEKQLAQQPQHQPISTDAKLEKLQQNIAEQQSSNISADASLQGTDNNFTDSSDTPTLEKMLYPQLSESKNLLKGHDASKVNSTGEIILPKNPQTQDSLLQTAENFLSEKQDNQNETQSTQTDADAKESAEERKTVATLVAGVVSEQIKHFKASEMRMAYSPVADTSNSTNASSDNVISEASRDQRKLQQAVPGSPYKDVSQASAASPIQQQSLPSQVLPNQASSSSTNQSSNFVTGANAKASLASSEDWSPQGVAAKEGGSVKRPDAPQLGPGSVWSKLMPNASSSNASSSTNLYQSQQQNIYQQQQQTAYPLQQQNVYPKEQLKVNSPSTITSPTNVLYLYPKQSQQDQNTSSGLGQLAATSPIGQADKVPESAWPAVTPSNTAVNKPATQLNPRPDVQVSVAPTPVTVKTENASSQSIGDKTYRVHLKPHIYTPKVQLYKWPPVAFHETGNENSAQPEIATGSQVQVVTATSQHYLHGAMTLQQTWHPLLENENSLPYRVLKEHIQHSIEETYASHHLSVVCKVTGLRRAPRKTSHATTMEKVGVTFELAYVNDGGTVLSTMKQVAKNGVISELLVYPDTVSVSDNDTPSTISPPEMPSQLDQASITEQNLVATSPVPLDNASRTNPENSTQMSNYTTQVPSTKPVEATKPLDVTRPVEAAKPVEMTNPMDATKPLDVTRPVEAVKPVEMTNPMDATKPLDVTRPVEAVKPVEMTNPMDATKPLDVTKPPEVAKPAESTKPVEPNFEFVTAPKDIPKSCEEIRDSGIGKSDGQYVLEARKGCHLSVICQNMEDKHPKEFLGGPNKSEWEAYPFAALIKISSHDKENIQSGACLENSDEGRKLLEQIYRAKGKQSAPTPPWHTNIKRLLEGRRKREIKRVVTVISKANKEMQRKNERYPRSSGREGEDWGVL